MTAAERLPTRDVLVEVLFFDGCPNFEQTAALVQRIARELGLKPVIRLVRVGDAESAARLGFLGSPSVRLGGKDVEPGADERTDYALVCRVYRIGQGLFGQPDERWIRDALLREAGGPAPAGSPAQGSRLHRSEARRSGASRPLHLLLTPSE